MILRLEDKRLSNTITIGNITFAGGGGGNTTALAGSIFYDRHNIVEDAEAGKFDTAKASKLISDQDMWSKKTGIPAMVDIVASSPRAIEQYIDFAAEETEAPLLIDGSDEEVRLAGARRCRELGILSRTIYNSISAHSSEKELKELKEIGIKAAVLLCYNPTDFSLKGRLDILEKLLQNAEKAGIEQPLADTSVIDLPSLGMAKELIANIKEKYSIPVGNSPHNAVSRWPGLKGKFPGAKESCTVVAHAVPVSWGADFLIYGPIRHAEVIFPGVGLVEACLGQLSIEHGKMPGPDHPLFKMA